jgi:FlaG/FlaF family flagellin (archaellin)
MTKKLRRIFRDKRAVTPVLSNVLLMVIAVAAMAIATTATYVITTNLKETMSERIIVEDLWFNNSTLDIDVYLRNVGKVAVQVSAVYVNHTKQSFYPTPFTLEIGMHDWLSIMYDWTSSNLYYVDIVTTRGTHIAEYYKAP